MRNEGHKRKNLECRIGILSNENAKFTKFGEATTISSVCTKWRRFLHPISCGTITKLVIVCNSALFLLQEKHEEFMADNWPAPNDLEDATDQKRKAEIT